MHARRGDATATLDRLSEGVLEDKDLTLAFQRGEKGAYQAIHDRYAGRVTAVCRRMLGDPDDASEAAQETFLRVYLALARFNGRYQLGPWITRIATNICLDQLRSRTRHATSPAPVEEIHVVDDGRQREADPQVIALRNAESRRVRRTLERLSPMHRAAIVLRDFEGLSYQEIAVALGLSDTQVKALLHRARGAFRRSWRSSLAALVTFRGLRQRLAAGAEPATQTLSSAGQVADRSFSVAQAMSSCSAGLQQCGQFVSERVAPIVAAAVVGTASVAAGAAVATSRPAVLWL